MYVDLGAEPLIAAEKDDAQIAIEIKTFLGSSAINEFHTALGQYLNYLVALEDQHPGRVLYLAVPVETYESFFRLEFGQIAVRRYHLKLIVYDLVALALLSFWFTYDRARPNHRTLSHTLSAATCHHHYHWSTPGRATALPGHDHHG
jgi:hypothetical protein